MELLRWARAQWDRAAAIAAGVAGAGALLAGWIGISGTAYTAKQLPYMISGGMVGIFLLGVACTLWLSADLRDEWRKLDGLEDAVRLVGLQIPAVPEAETFLRQPEVSPGNGVTTKTEEPPARAAAQARAQ
jgi:hypothetical protein